VGQQRHRAVRPRPHGDAAAVEHRGHVVRVRASIVKEKIAAFPSLVP
jgi:hypothetical protein